MGSHKHSLRRILGLLFSLVVIGTAGYVYLLPVDWLSALYMTIITISTVGYSEIVAPMTPEARIFTIGLILVGIGTAGYALSTIALYVVEGRIQAYWKGKQMDKEISRLKNHIIICGEGELEFSVAEQLGRGKHQFLTIDPDLTHVQSRSDANHLMVCGCPSEEETLLQAGIMRAKAIIAVQDKDVDNIVTVLTARTLNPDILIISVSHDRSAVNKLTKVGADRTLSVAEISGRRLAAMATNPNIMTFLDVMTRSGTVELELDELDIESGSKLDGVTLLEAQIPQKTGLNILALRKEKEHFNFNPKSSEMLEVGMVLMVFGTADKIVKLRELCASKK